MKLFCLTRSISLPISLDNAWEFFSNPKNLSLITPPSLRMTITSLKESHMYAGQIISYRIYPFCGIPMNWVTEITHVEPPHFFVDEQRYGPYRIWHHEHRFVPVEGGVEAQDTVHYMLPFGPIGLLMQRILVGRQIAQIFDYRSQVLRERFGTLNS